MVHLCSVAVAKCNARFTITYTALISFRRSTAANKSKNIAYYILLKPSFIIIFILCAVICRYVWKSEISDFRIISNLHGNIQNVHIILKLIWIYFNRYLYELYYLKPENTVSHFIFAAFETNKSFVISNNRV